MIEGPTVAARLLKVTMLCGWEAVGSLKLANILASAWQLSTRASSSQSLAESWRAPSTGGCPEETFTNSKPIARASCDENATRFGQPRVISALPVAVVDASAKWRRNPQTACPSYLDDSVGRWSWPTFSLRRGVAAFDQGQLFAVAC